MDIVVIDEDEPNSLLDTEDIYYQIVASTWNHAVAIFGSAQGRESLTQFVRAYRAARSSLRTYRPQDLVTIFLRKLRSTSPMLAIKTEATRLVGYHNRGSWRGTHGQFNIRAQMVRINKRWVDNLKNEMNPLTATYRNDRGRQEDLLTLATFKLVHMFTHEIFHILVTFLDYGDGMTPPNIRAAQSRSDDTTAGEGGEFSECLLYGGLIDFFDRHDRSDSTGIPMLITEDRIEHWVRATRVTTGSIARLLSQDFDNDAEAWLVRTTGRSMRVNGRSFSDRPQVEARQLSSRLQSFRMWRRRHRGLARQHPQLGGVLVERRTLRSWLKQLLRVERSRR